MIARLAALLLAVWPLPAPAQDVILSRPVFATGGVIVQPLLGMNDDGYTVGTTEYTAVVGPQDVNLSATIADHEQLVAHGMTCTALDAHTSGDIGVDAETLTFTLLKNGSAGDLACQITGVAPGTDCTQDAGSLHFNPGDRIVMEVVSSATATVRATSWWVTCTGDSQHEFSLIGRFGTASSTAARIGPFSGARVSSTGTGNNEDVDLPTPEASTAKALYVRLDAPLTAGNRTYTVEKNNAPTALTCVINSALGSPGDQECSFATDVAMAAGDLIHLLDVPVTPTPTTSAVAYGLRVTNTAARAFIASDSTDGTAGTRNIAVSSGGSGSFGTESTTSVQGLTPALTVYAVACALGDAAPGSGNSFIYALRDDAANAMTCTVADTALQATNTGSATIAASSLINWQRTESGTPTASTGWTAATAVTTP